MFTTKAEWGKKRWEYLEAARACRSALTNPEGYWNLPADSQRVRDAVSVWVHKARNAHAFSLGRKPVIPNFVYINNDLVISGGLYGQ